MKNHVFVWALLTIFIQTVALAQSQTSSIDFISRIQSDDNLAKSIGLSKLNEDEKNQLNIVFNAIYQLGAESIGTIQNNTTPPFSASKSNGEAYMAKIDSDDGDILSLDNGAVIEIISGYVGYIGYRKDAVLWKSGNRWRIWIEGKRVYNCELLRSPSYGRKSSVEELYIQEVRSNGTLLVMDNGALYEVDSYFTIDSSLWLGLSEALLIDDYKLINLDEGEMVEVTKLR